MSSSKPELYISLISGTSIDGIDAALVDFSRTQPRLINARNIPDNRLESLTALDLQAAEVFADACLKAA